MSRVLKQHNVKYIGTFIHIMYFSMPLVGLAVQCASAATFYGVWRLSLLSVFPWLTLPVFIAIIAVLGIVVLFIAYKFLYRSYYEFQNSQQFPENSPLMIAIRKTIRDELSREKKP